MLKIRELQKKRQEEAAATAAAASKSPTPPSNNPVLSSSSSSSISGFNLTPKVGAAQLRIQKDISELDLPRTIKVSFPDPSDVFHWKLIIKPTNGFYKNGKFHFKIEITQNFPIDPPKIKCLDRIYHPNIDLDGNICLNILREDWSPVLSLNSVLIGLNFLFLEPNPNDPLNKEAANMLVKNKRQFERNVYNSMRGGAIESFYYDVVV